MKKFSPRHTDLAAIQDKSCMTSPKTGYWMVGCYVDKDPDRLRQYYKGEEQVTPSVCFEFCKYMYGAQFFFLKHGRECSCGRYYHKGGKGGLGGCTKTCEGDNQLFCGGDAKETVYSMHDCNAVAYKPMSASEGRHYQIEITKNGAQFFSGAEMVERPELTMLENGTEVLMQATQDSKQFGLRVVVIDPHNGAEKNAMVFYIDGYKVSSGKIDGTFANEEAARFRDYVWDSTLVDDIVMIAATAHAFSQGSLQWWEDVK
jgi:hypothetical protein